MLNGWPLTDRFAELRREMDRMFEEFDRFGLSPLLRRGVYPAVNLWDEGEAIGVEAELPGVSRDDLEIFAAGNELTIKGRRKAPEDEQATYYRQERGTGEFTRTITLPCEVDADKIDATLCNGVLTLRLTKAEEAKPRQIEVKVK
ncbi:MAG: Hsp20/alpha crystallin family protein [Planctomycetota bacterium]|nr:MAG: Hsp20/alpha crystallin family protein [Planctomycetota bacterium]